MLAVLLELLLDALGVKGTFSDRHRPWIMGLFICLLVMLSLGVIVALAMVLSGHT